MMRPYELEMLLETGEPCALKGASTVRGGAVGNVLARVTRLPPTLHHIAISAATTAACMRSGEPGRFPEHIAAGLEPHQPARLYHSYFPPKRQLLLEQLVQWLVQVEKGFRGTLDFAYALLLLCEEATLLRYSSDHFAINWYRSGFSIIEQGEQANSLYLVLSVLPQLAEDNSICAVFCLTRS